MFFGSLQAKMKRSVLFVLDDADEAGYFYHDLTQMMGQESVFFFPSSYRRAVKYGQRDAANEILTYGSAGTIVGWQADLYRFLS